MPLGFNFLIYKMGIYKKDIVQRIAVRISEVTLRVRTVPWNTMHAQSFIFLYII